MKNGHKFVILATIGALCVPMIVPKSAIAQEIQLRLKANPTVSAGQITLGDIFENAGDKSGQIIARAPSAGQNTVFSASVLQARVASMGLAWRNGEGVRQVIIHGAPSSRPQFGSTNNYAPAAQENTNRFNTQSGPTATTNNNVQIAVLSREVQKDEIITANMVSWVNAPQNLANDVIIDAENLIGSVAKRRINASSPVRNTDIGPALGVRRGQPVTLIHEAGGLRISLRGRALSDGAIGSSIRAVNIATNKTLEAIVESDGVARVLIPTTSASVSHSYNSAN